MKRFNLISILILFFTFFGVQFIIAATQVADGVWEDNGNYYVIFNESWKSYNIQGDGNERLNKTYYFNYPSKQLTFYAETVGAIKTYPLNIISCNQSDIKQIDNKDKFNYTINDQNCRTLKFSVTENKTFVRKLTEIKLQMAPHIIMKTESVDFMFNLSNESKETKKEVKFHSFLTAGPLTYSIVNKDDDTPNTYFTLHETKTVGSNTFCSTSDEDRNQYTFKVSFNPSENIDGYYYARIKITDDTSTEYVDLSGYKYNLNLHWEQELPELTVDEPFTLIADTYDDNGNGPIAKEISVTYIWSPVNALSIIYPEKPEETYPIITPKKSYESVTITAIKNGNTYYNSSKTIEKTIKIKPADQSLIWEDFELTTADKDITITDVLCQSTKYNLLNQLGETITYSSSNPNVVEINNNNTLTVHKYGETVTITASQAGKEGYINPATATKTITPSIGTIRFDTDGNWNTTSNWLPVSELNTQRNVAPSAVVNAEIAADATISNTGTINQINDITFNGGSLAITATSALKANKITNENADNLILKASAKGNATLIYANGTPEATVEIYSKAENGTLDYTDGKNPQWQYVGVAVDGTTTSAFSNAWLLKWTEAESADNGDPWSEAPLDANIALVPWAGYSISQPVDTTYSTKGSLMRGDHTYTLTRTESTDPDCGFNLLANSYTAPIDITKLTKDDFENADARADACIVLFNTGTYADWESQTGKSGENPGQLTVIPVEAARAIAGDSMPTTIASMQAFFVMAREDGATFTVDYQRAVAGASNHGNQMRAPEAQDEFNVLKIMIKGENSRDHLFLLENENTSKAYDNGYEARKIFDAPRGHQMYATCQYGYASIDCSESFVGQTIGLKGDNEGEMLTISFDTDRLYDYQSLYLYDKVTGKYVNILSGEKYTFFGIKGANDNRFSIVTNPDDKAQTPPFVIIGNELAFDKSQINSDNANIYIYDTSGRLLMTDKINPYENYNIPDMPAGIYLVSMNGYTTKIVRK